MANAPKTTLTTEYGDFQTPASLARQVCDLVRGHGVNPASIVEPTCGIGNFLFAALDAFPETRHAVAVEINPQYIAKVRQTLLQQNVAANLSLQCASFFDWDWRAELSALPDPILVIGNPPWVTNAALGRLNSTNLPDKANFQNHRGMDALTGKSNFDVSEWMLIKLLEGLNGRNATLAMLCKRAVARKVLLHAWRHGLPITEAALYGIDAGMHFDAAVEACLLFVSLGPGPTTSNARLYHHLAYTRPTGSIGFRDGLLISDAAAFDRWRNLLASNGPEWRSGIKHDCSAVMELARNGDSYLNGLGTTVQLEDTYLYPMLKSSDLARGNTQAPQRRMLVPQSSIGADTSIIELEAPLTWRYLQAHAQRLARRGSSIYKNKPPFSVFGVGDYSFVPWKVAISGLYKSLDFRIVGPHHGKPVVFDDTCYFLACATEQDARTTLELVQSQAAQEFLNALIFWDAKRPVTVDVLRRLDLTRLAQLQGFTPRAYPAARCRPAVTPIEDVPTLFG